ncbi:MAG TPA: hypothetical protein VJ979_09875 [Actinomycetota bacterium]|nr:hypothetical protein [Actinomycetota bacterium]
MTFVGSLAGMDSGAIAIWGDSYSEAEALVVRAVDERVTAVVAQVPACGPVLPTPDPVGSMFAAMRDTLLGGETEGTIDGPMPVVSADQLNTPSLLSPIQAFRWFMSTAGATAPDGRTGRHESSCQRRPHSMPASPPRISTTLSS